MKLQNFFSSMLVLGICTLMLMGSSFLVANSIRNTYAGINPAVNAEMETTHDFSRQDAGSAS